MLRRLRTLLPQGGSSLVALGSAAAAAMAVLVWAAAKNGVTFEGAVSDQHEVTRLRLLGIVSSTGVLLWTAAVAFCLLAASAVEPIGAGRRWRRFFLASAAVTLVLLVDDFLLVHEFSDEVVSVFVDFDRTREQKDILEAAVFTGYGLLFLVYGYYFRTEILGSRHRRFLVAAAVMFALSLFIDLGGVEFFGVELPDDDSSFDVESLAEEGPKFVGIVYYAAFYHLVARSVLQDWRRGALSVEVSPDLGSGSGGIESS